MQSIRKIIDTMVIIPRDNGDEGQNDQPIILSLPQRLVNTATVTTTEVLP